MLERYDWPGNIRELQNVMERAVVLSRGASLEPGDLPPLEGGPPPDGSAVAAAGPFHEAVLAFKRECLRAALARAGGNQTQAARALGLQRTYLSRLLKELGIRGADREAAGAG